MKITVRLRYQTRFGQALFLCGDHIRFGGGRQEQALPLRYVNEELWEMALDLPDTPRPKTPVSYYFLLRNADGSVRGRFRRRPETRSCRPCPAATPSSWIPGTTWARSKIFFSPNRLSMFCCRRNKRPSAPDRPPAPRTVQRQSAVAAERTDDLPAGRRRHPGRLEPSRAGIASALTRRTAASASSSICAGEPFPVAYKYGVYDLERNAFVRYEDGANRVLAEAAPPGGRVMVNDGFARLPGASWRGAGVAMPVFSLRSEKSFGVGEFLDLPLLADWARRAGLKLIQILPVNDTSATHTWMDSYPYAGISAFALHPLYLNLDRVAGKENRPLLKSLARQREQLNALETVDYEAVMKAKLAFVRKIFPAQREKTFASAEYRKFFAQNQHWLAPYAAFCFLRDKFGTADFNQWPEHRVYDAKKISALAARDSAARDEMALHCFIQFHLHLQLREAADYLHGAGLDFEGRHRHRRPSSRRGCLAAAGLVSHRHAGRRAAGRLRRQGPELGLSHLQLAAHEAGRLCLVEAAFCPDELLF